MSIADVDVDN